MKKYFIIRILSASIYCKHVHLNRFILHINLIEYEYETIDGKFLLVRLCAYLYTQIPSKSISNNISEAIKLIKKRNNPRKR